MRRRVAALLVCLFSLAACCGSVRRQGSSVVVRLPQQDGGRPARLRVQWVDEDIVRISATPERRFADRRSLTVVPQRGYRAFRLVRADGTVEMSSPRLRVRVDGTSGAVSFYTADGELLLDGSDAEMSFLPVEAERKTAYTVCTGFRSPEDEPFYGLGQHQEGDFNRKGQDEELYQYNTRISVPFVVSGRGYGLLFDAYSLSRWGDPAPYEQLGRIFRIYDKDGTEGALTGTYTDRDGRCLVRREDSLYFENERTVRALPDMELKGARVVYEGFIEAPVSGEYSFVQYYAGYQRTEIGGRETMSRRWRPAWNPNSCKYRVRLEAGERVPVRVEWEPDGGVSYLGLRAKAPREDRMTSIRFWSEFEPQIDYYFIAGGDYDRVIAGYRRLTGKAPVMPRWALGFWQSRERYATQEELVGTLAELRRRGIPADNIVQDWQYWLPDQWGSHEFDTGRYPDPERMLDDVHALHGRFMISVWPKFYTNTGHYKELRDAGFAYVRAEQDSVRDWLGHFQSFYDAYAAGGRKLFWKQLDESLYSRYGRKIDAWWMDASEPNLRDCLPLDYLKWLLSPTALGPSAEYLNAYALVNAQAIYEGQRSVDPDKRVFLLTRNGFAGLQRYSTASWSGDIGTSWLDMRAQMAAGLNYSMSGIPFWGMDIGGFSVEDRFAEARRVWERSGVETPDLQEWRELQTRWHQFGAFVPLFRTHGQWPPRELWNIAPEDSETYRSILYYMKLRYRLMPYLYSLAGAVHFADATMLRGLPMDFPDDPAVRGIDDQWLFGPALMPAPVSEYGARSRRVHFPAGCGWYDFYDGHFVPGGQDLEVPAPYGRIPLYVRAGSILPVGPDMQWSDEKAADPLRLFVYAGADGRFVLYEDENVNYNYEKGAYATIPFSYDDASRTLRIGAREGAFPGMLQERRFIVVPVSPACPLAGGTDADGIEIRYDGQEITLNL